MGESVRIHTVPALFIEQNRIFRVQKWAKTGNLIQKNHFWKLVVISYIFLFQGRCFILYIDCFCRRITAPNL